MLARSVAVCDCGCLLVCGACGFVWAWARGGRLSARSVVADGLCSPEPDGGSTSSSSLDHDCDLRSGWSSNKSSSMWMTPFPASRSITSVGAGCPLVPGQQRKGVSTACKQVHMLSRYTWISLCWPSSSFVRASLLGSVALLHSHFLVLSRSQICRCNFNCCRHRRHPHETLHPRNLELLHTCNRSKRQLHVSWC